MFRPINIRTFTFFLSLWAGLQGTLQLGFVRLNLISLEHRFSFTTSQLAYILASYDVASVFFLLPLTYMTARSRVDKSRLFPLGLILMGVGALILCIPQFLTPPVTITNSNNDTDLCIIGHEPPNLRVVEPAPSRRVIVGIFVLGQALIGIGSTPLYTLAVTWIDENIPKRNSALYVGFFFTSTILGPAVGYIVGGYVLDHLHTDFLTQKMPLNIDSSSKAWIGAWWLLFMGIADISIVLGIVVFFYPKDLTRKEPAEMYNTQEQGDGKTPLRVMLKSLMQNPIFTGLSLVSICEAYILSSFNSFMSKYVQNQFGLSTEGSSIIMGCLIVPAGFLGIISGKLLQDCCIL
uniref:Solute carrier organic anion transporter family member 4A1 n=1 Tax=Cacopsylla melanoneura TaxID=428564 RepID=A0A8D9BMG3_9HEMI